MNAILFLGDFFSDARCINMADTIIDAGKEIVIIDAGNGDESYRNNKIYHISLSASGIYKYLKFYQQSKKILKTLSPICIIAGDLYSLPSAASQSSYRLIYDSREIYTQLAELKGSPIKQIFWNFIEKLFINQASMVIVTAESDGVVLKSIYADIQYIILKNFPSKRNLPAIPIDLHSKLNINKSSPLFLYQGVLHKGRGIEQVFHLLNHFKSAHYLILGQGEYRDELEIFSTNLGIQSRVHFLGRIPYSRLMSYTASATIGFSLIEPLSQSYEYALPNKIFEYAAVGLPVIATDLPEMKKAIIENKLGHCVTFGDDVILIKTVEKILKKKAKYKPNYKLFWETQADNFLEIL